MDVEGGEEEGIQLVASYASLAPVLDCCVVEGEGGGAVSFDRPFAIAEIELTL